MPILRPPLAIDHLGKGIRRRAISGVVATAGGQGCQIVLTFAYNVVLARLITPGEFGLVAMAMVFAGFVQIFKDAGLSTATIQREDITQAQVSNLFWLNAAMGAGAMVTMMAAAPLVARFFHHPELVTIVIAISVSLPLEALAVQHTAILNRQMRFGLVSAIDLGCTAAGCLIGAIMAVSGWGYWSLVGTLLSTVILKVTCVSLLSGWYPQRPSRHSGTRPLIGFGTHLTLVGVVSSLWRSCDSLLIGRYFGADALGLYSRSTVLVTRPLERLLWPIYSVVVPSLSRLQKEPQRYRRAFLQVFEALTMTGFFLAGLLYPLAGTLVIVILGRKWSAAAPIFAALTLLCLSRPSATAAAWLFTTQGRGRDLLVTACAEAAIFVAAFVVGVHFGPTGLAIAYSAASLTATVPLTLYLGGRKGPVRAHDMWFCMLSHSPMFATTVAATWLAREWMFRTATPVLQLFGCLTIGTGVGIATLWAFPKSQRAARTVLGSCITSGPRAHTRTGREPNLSRAGCLSTLILLG